MQEPNLGVVTKGLVSDDEDNRHKAKVKSFAEGKQGQEYDLRVAIEDPENYNENSS